MPFPTDPSFPTLGPGALFFANPAQKSNPLLYANTLFSNADFYQKNKLDAPTPQQIQAALTRDTQIRDTAKTQTIAAAAVAGGLVAAGVAPTVYLACVANPFACTQAFNTGAGSLSEGGVVALEVGAGTVAAKKVVDEAKAFAQATKEAQAAAAAKKVADESAALKQGAETTVSNGGSIKALNTQVPKETIFNTPALRTQAETILRENLSVTSLPPSNGVNSAYRGLIAGDPRAAVVAEVYDGGKVIGISHIRTENTGLPTGSAGLFIKETLTKVGIAPTEQLRLTGIINPAALEAYSAGLAPETTSLGKAGLNALQELGLEAKAIRFEKSGGKLNIVIDIQKPR